MMNREILFRGKRIPDNHFSEERWVEGQYFFNVNGDEKEHCIHAYRYNEKIWHNFSTHIVKPETIGQYTGLEDSNGNKIFEGDILEVTDVDDFLNKTTVTKHAVKYEAPEFTVTGISNVEMNMLNYVLLCGKVEVVGNVHDD